MAKRISNQITFTEQKKLIEIRELYLATNLNIEDLITSEDMPLDATDGSLWFNIAADVNDNKRLMVFENEEWVVCAEQFTPSIQTTNDKKPYLWNYEETVYSIGAPEISFPILIGTYGKGADGKGILYIYNYYGATKNDTLPAEEDMPENFWKESFSSIGSLSSENKYLWNYERIIYTDGTEIKTDPVIIGVYGDSGENAITFNIYSTNGFEFVNSVDVEEKIDTIKLQLASFEGSSPLVYDENIGPIYTWYWWNPNIETYVAAEVTSETVGEYWILENGEYIQKTLPDDGYNEEEIYYTLLTISDYEEILSTNEPSFEVNINDNYALSNLKCIMTYNGNDYISYVTLAKKIDVYNANIKFFNDTNIFAQTEKYMPVYVELYKNNKLEESIKTSECYIGNSSVNKTTGIINTDYVILDNDINNDEVALLSYFVCSVEGDNTGNREIILGEYNAADKIWQVADDSAKYFYVNDINTNSISHVFLIKKEDVNRSRDINVLVYTEATEEVDDDGNIAYAISSDSLVAMTHAVVTDLNDVIIDSVEPNGYEGQMWLDTTNGILKVYTNGQWVNSAKQQTGQGAYTIKPNVYNEGDLWIVTQADAFTYEITEKLEDGSTRTYTKEFAEGSIWIATQSSGLDGFNPVHWSDAVPKITALQTNIREHFTFNEDTGLKISQKTNYGEKFYININSQRMSFCVDESVIIPEDEEVALEYDPNEVVHISGQSATIRNLKVENGAYINGETTSANRIHIVNPDKSNIGFTWQLEENGSLSLIKKVGVD